MEALFTRLTEISMIASWLILFILILRLCFTKASKSFYCLLWGIVGLRLVFPFSIESIFSLIPRKEIIYPTIESGVAILDQTIQYNIQTEITPITQSFNWMELFTNIWILGMIVLLTYCIVSYYRLYKKVNICLHYKDNIYYCDHIDSPFILGILNPKIYLPSTFDESQIEYILKHENAHLKRKDHLWKPIGFALLTIYWFNPMIWIAYAHLCKDIESACDEYVIKEMDSFNKKMYSETLFTCSVDRKLIMVCPLAFGEVGVKERIKSIVNYKKPSFWVLCVSLVACIVLSVGFLTEPKTNQVTNFTFTTGLLNKEIKLNKEQKENVLELLDNYTFNYKSSDEVMYGGSFYRISYIKEKKTYTWKISQSQTYLEIKDGNKITSYNGNNTQLFDSFKKYESLAQESIKNENQLNMINMNTSTLSELITGNILVSYNTHDRPTASFCVESHITLAGEQGTALVGDASELLKISQFLVVLYQEFNLIDNEPMEVYRSYSPAIITFDVVNNHYVFKEYWQPAEGNDYQKEIIERFPGEIANDAINNQKYLEQLEKENLLKLNDYLSKTLIDEQITYAFYELYTAIIPYDNGYTDEDYNNAEGEKCLHDRGTYQNENMSLIKVNIQSDPHRLKTYIVYIYNLNENRHNKIYVNESDYFEIQEILKNKGFIRND